MVFILEKSYKILSIKVSLSTTFFWKKTQKISFLVPSIKIIRACQFAYLKARLINCDINQIYYFKKMSKKFLLCNNILQ